MPSLQETARIPRRIFSPIAPDYDRPAQILGLFQYRRWHRFLLARARHDDWHVARTP